MHWKKLGIVWAPHYVRANSLTHAMGPTPWRKSPDAIRVFVTCLDGAGRGRPYYVDVSAEDPTHVLKCSGRALLDLGVRGSFDDNGAVAMSVVQHASGALYMYYAGFEQCTKVRYRIFTGLAISDDGGESFRRYSKVPVLDRSDDELYFRCGPFALLDRGKTRLWYIAGNSWMDIGGKAMPIYDLKYLESSDGIRWSGGGVSSMRLENEDEHGFGRPWVVKRGESDYQLFYSIRRRSLGAYRLGYAESADGIVWQRKDSEMGLDVSVGAFDSDAIMYSAVISIGERTYCFYNGNEFGRDGFAVAELVR